MEQLAKIAIVLARIDDNSCGRRNGGITVVQNDFAGITPAGACAGFVSRYQQSAIRSFTRPLLSDIQYADQGHQTSDRNTRTGFLLRSPPLWHSIRWVLVGFMFQSWRSWVL
jgi:hypothetical protein